MSNNLKQNWSNKTIWTGDNLPIMRGMNSDSIDLIYLDPPFNSNVNYAAPIGSKAAGAEFKDTWNLTDIDIAWLDLIETKYPKLNRVIQSTMTDNDKSYLIYMSVRLLEMKRLLKSTGSIYLHCDPTMSHYLKLVMDAIFGRKNFRNEIVWGYTGPGSPKMRQFNRKHDIIFWFSKGEKWTFNSDAVRIPYKDPNQRPRRAFDTGGGAFKLDNIERMRKRGKIPESWWVQEPGNGFCIVARSKNENTGYPTQKPLKLLQRIIEASSSEGDMILDPFCGCATTCVSADALNRQWVGIDISEKAAELVRQRINDLTRNIIHRKDIPQRTDLGEHLPYSSTINKTKLYGFQKGVCNGCSTHFEYRNLEVDHIISRKEGGTDHLDNLQLLCGNCNRVKGDRGMEYLKSKFQY